MRADSLSVEEFLTQSKRKLIIDVRAPIEFKKGHLPGAINIPLFDDLERAEIGTLYKANGKEEAIMKGLEIVSPKLTAFIRQTRENTGDNEVFVYCFRGGMRSNSFGWLLSTAGLKVRIMQGGYKAYRNYVLNYFSTPFKIILLGGATGSGKTEILHHLKTSLPIIDLELLAHHKGSAFGGINQPAQPPQQLFENQLFNQLSLLNRQVPVLIEDESMSIGFNKIPYAFWQQMKSAPIIKIIVPFELRVKRLVQDYGSADKDLLAKSIRNIAQQLGPANYKNCMLLLDEGKLADVAAVTLQYYDKAYNYNHTKKNITEIITIDTDTANAEINAKKIREVVINYGKHSVNTIQ